MAPAHSHAPTPTNQTHPHTRCNCVCGSYSDSPPKVFTLQAMNPLLSFSRCLLVLAALVLAGCSAMRVVDSDVTTFAPWQGATGAPGTTYRFERLPSQQALPAQPKDLSQDQLEALAIQKLERFGLVHRPDAALLTVQLGASGVVQPASFSQGFYGGSGVTVGTGTAGSFIGLSFPVMRTEPPLYLRELSVIMRDSRSHAVVYETRARHSGVWADARAIWPAMMDAALNGFPNPPAGPRRVNVEIPR